MSTVKLALQAWRSDTFLYFLLWPSLANQMHKPCIVLQGIVDHPRELCTLSYISMPCAILQQLTKCANGMVNDVDIYQRIHAVLGLVFVSLINDLDNQSISLTNSKWRTLYHWEDHII